MNDHNPHTLYSRDPHTGKYKPVAEYETFNYLREGSYIVDVRPGCTSMRRMIFPERYAPEFEVLVERLKEAIIKAFLEKKSEPIDVPRKLTKAQKEAWLGWKKAFKKDIVYLRSLQESIDMAMDEVVYPAAASEPKFRKKLI
jgi:hypothetical protein